MKLSSIFIAIILSTHSASAQSSFTSSEIETVQQKLSDSGYDVGTVDGRYGRKTAAGIRQYQADWKLPRTGKIDRALIDRLEQNHPDTMSRWQKVESQDCEVWNSEPQAQATATWTGGCAEGKVTGTGRFVWSYLLQGQTYENTYEGAYRDGKPHGQGTYAWDDGSRYKGAYRDGRRHGQGVFDWASGSSYEGEYRDGKRNGQGIYTWGDGSRYKGAYRDDKPHGDGEYYDSGDGETVRGSWRDGCLSADGKNRAVATTLEACGFK